MSAIRLNAISVSVAHGDHTLNVTVWLNDKQRWDAVKQLLGVGISEQEAYEGIKRLFPEWFEVTA